MVTSLTCATETTYMACAGEGGAHRHYGPTYIGLWPPPTGLCLNLFNIDYRQPQNKWVSLRPCVVHTACRRCMHSMPAHMCTCRQARADCCQHLYNSCSAPALVVFLLSPGTSYIWLSPGTCIDYAKLWRQAPAMLSIPLFALLQCVSCIVCCIDGPLFAVQ